MKKYLFTWAGVMIAALMILTSLVNYEGSIEESIALKDSSTFDLKKDLAKPLSYACPDFYIATSIISQAIDWP